VVLGRIGEVYDAKNIETKLNLRDLGNAEITEPKISVSIML